MSVEGAVEPPKATLGDYLTGEVRRGGDGPTDDLVGLKFRRVCTECGNIQWLDIDYADLGLVIRTGCAPCGEVTRQRPVWNDFRYRLHQLDIEPGRDPR